MMNRFALGSAALLALSGATLAQTAAPAPVTAPPAAAPMPSTAAPVTAPMAGMDHSGMGGMMMATSATVPVKFITVGKADFITSNLIGANVYNNQNESLGEVEDLVIQGGKTVTGVVVSVGGFLGLGESYVVLDPSTLALADKDGTWRVMVNTNKEALTAAPKFTYPAKRS